jgi:hypothetical protein
MICEFIEKYQSCFSYCEFGGNGSADVAISIVVGLVFFLQIHYALDAPSRAGHCNVLFHQMGLATLDDLTATWEKKKARITSYSKMPTRTEFAWSDLDSYLHYCDGLGMRKQGQAEPSSGSSLLVYPDESPSWRNVELTIEDLNILREFRKCWSVLTTKIVEELPRPLSLLITVASAIVDWQPRDLLNKLNKMHRIKL